MILQALFLFVNARNRRDDAFFGMLSCRMKLDLDIQKEYAVKLCSERRSMGQTARLTGMSKATVFRAGKRSRDGSGMELGLLLHESESAAYFDAGVIW